MMGMASRASKIPHNVALLEERELSRERSDTILAEENVRRHFPKLINSAPSRASLKREPCFLETLLSTCERMSNEQCAWASNNCSLSKFKGPQMHAGPFSPPLSPDHVCAPLWPPKDPDNSLVSSKSLLQLSCWLDRGTADMAEKTARSVLVPLVKWWGQVYHRACICVVSVYRATHGRIWASNAKCLHHILCKNK